MPNKTLKYVILACIFLVPFVPLIVSSSLFFPFITGKAFAFRLLVEVMFACYLILILRDPLVRPKFSWILAILTVFLVLVGLADIFAVNPYKAFWSNYERMEGYVTLLHLAAYFVVAGSLLRTSKMWDRLLATTLGASAVMAIYSFFQLAGKITINQGGVRVDGTLGNAAYLAVYMLFHIFIAGLLFTRFKGGIQRFFIMVVALMDLVVLYFTATRGAILGFLGGVLITFLFLLLRSEKGAAVRKIAVGGLLAFAVFVGIFISVKDSEWVRANPVLGRFASLSFDEIKTQGRYYVWPMAWKGFLERPILGWGQEGFNFVFNKYYVPQMWSQEPWFDRAHSAPLDWLVAAGAPGFLAYILIFGAAIYSLAKANKEDLSQNQKAILLGLLAAYFFNNLFVFDQTVSYILFFTVLAYLHAHAPETKFALWDKIAAKLGAKLGQGSKPVIEALVMIAAVFVVYSVVYAPWRQNKQLLAVLRLNNEGQIGEVSDYAAPLQGGMGFSEALEHVSQTAIALSDADAPEEFKQELFAVVDEAFQQQIERSPSDARYRLFYASFLSKYGWYGRALAELEAGRELSPNKQQILFEISRNSLLDNKPAQAIEAAKTAYELDPSYVEARIFYALVLLQQGRSQLAEELLQGVPEETVIFDDRFLNTLLAAREYESIIGVAKRRIELEPTNLQHRLTLTAAYLEANRRAEAVQTLEELIRLSPDFKEQGEYFISEIRAGRNP